MARKKEPTTGITLRLPDVMLRRFHEMAATVTLSTGGKVFVTPQDIMRDWLQRYSGSVAEVVDRLRVNQGKEATTGITLRLSDSLLRRFHELAANATLSTNGGLAVTAQDVMRVWLEKHPGLKDGSTGQPQVIPNN
ncbi:hypothetical protein ACFFU8_09120 [Chromobacterium piscinae]|uniref:hypothetical protein n=1 Tax=Chromobacterium piscinae TaxID=686831 RepID=UPI001E4E0DDF|nr:hypothetical protein [Chromobacterium piscinae]MCD5327935.1 hypothetical protein [Chromobacterium piscinae]